MDAPSRPLAAAALGVYVHVPYCRYRCPYCDFYLVVGRPPEAFVDQVLAEWDALPPRVGAAETLTSLYLGGGTPGLLTAPQLRRIVRGVTARVPLAVGAEVCLEVNPRDITPAALEGWLDAGVTRVSVGVQSLQEDVLRVLGRDHAGEEAREALRLLGRSGLATFSADLIFGVATQGLERLARDAEEMASLAPHLSTYCLTYEPGTHLHKRRSQGRLVVLEPDAEAERYETVQRVLAAAGMVQYEVSSHARPGHHAVHNRLYWAGANTVALGPAGASYLRFEDGTAHRWRNAPDLPAYLRGDRVTVDHDPLDAPAALVDRVYAGLRDMERGVDLPRLEAEHHAVLPPSSEAGLRREERAGALERVGERHFRLTAAGALVADRVARAVVLGGNG